MFAQLGIRVLWVGLNLESLGEASCIAKMTFLRGVVFLSQMSDQLDVLFFDGGKGLVFVFGLSAPNDIVGA